MLTTIKNKIAGIMYWLRCHTFTRYHIVDCRSPKNGYNWGYMDRSELILYANMSILKDFVEKEHGINHKMSFDGSFPSAEYCDSYNKAVDDLKSVYDWWTKDRAALEDQLSLRKMGLDGYRKIRDQIEETDQEKLTLLIKHRKFLWT